MEYGPRFTPTKDDDSVLKGGVPIEIDTRHQCITRMKEYDQLSLEVFIVVVKYFCSC